MKRRRALENECTQRVHATSSAGEELNWSSNTIEMVLFWVCLRLLWLGVCGTLCLAENVYWPNIAHNSTENKNKEKLVIWFLFFEFYFVEISLQMKSLNSRIIEPRNFEFEDTIGSSIIRFLSISLNLDTSLLIFGLRISNISSFIKFEFVYDIIHRTWAW